MAEPSQVRVVVMMGVSGVGKTTVGRALAERLGWAFADADAYHSADAKAKMARGTGLSDADRAPWLAALATLIIARLDGGPSLVLACSALKRGYRDRLAGHDPRIAFLWLDADPGTLRERLAGRADHFAGADLLASQLEALEPPQSDESRVYRLDALASVEHLVAEAVRWLAEG